MKHIMVVFLILFSCITYAGTADSKKKTSSQQVLVGSVCRTPEIVFDFQMPPVIYTTNLSPKQFLKKIGEKPCHEANGQKICTDGVTIFPEIQNTLVMKTKAIKAKNQLYLCPSQIIVQTKYTPPKIDVYLSNKYKKSSCEFKTIKEHEDYHVQTFQQSILFYNPQIKKFLIQTTQNLPAIVMKQDSDMTELTTRYATSVVQKFVSVQQYINQKVTEKNLAIDTPESYAETQAKCNNWEF